MRSTSPLADIRSSGRTMIDGDWIAVIREAADPALSSRQRGVMVREIAAREHAGPA